MRNKRRKGSYAPPNITTEFCGIQMSFSTRVSQFNYLAADALRCMFKEVFLHQIHVFMLFLR